MTGFFPDIIHCHDWQTALIPVYLRELYRMKTGYSEIKTVFTIHNLKFQGIFPRHDLGDVLGLEHVAAASDQLTQYDTINNLRGGLNYSDA
jgi:starch synthase